MNLVLLHISDFEYELGFTLYLGHDMNLALLHIYSGKLILFISYFFSFIEYELILTSYQINNLASGKKTGKGSKGGSSAKVGIRFFTFRTQD